MPEFAPREILDLFDAIKQGVPEAIFLGVVGDQAHTFGYHRARAVLPSDDYSVELPQDKRGDDFAASALDVGLPPEQMKMVSGRLLAACQANDPRLRALREFYGTVDGIEVIGWDRRLPATPSDDLAAESDDSHLTHVHLSFYRQEATNAAALAPIADVITGIPQEPAEEDEDMVRIVMRKGSQPALALQVRGIDDVQVLQEAERKALAATGIPVVELPAAQYKALRQHAKDVRSQPKRP